MTSEVPRVPTMDALDVAGKRVLLRADLNVPLNEGAVGDDFRIRSSLPTIQRLIERGAQVVVCSHLGRPKGYDPAFSMAPVTARLGELGGFATTQLSGVAGRSVAAELAAVPPFQACGKSVLGCRYQQPHAPAESGTHVVVHAARCHAH